MALENLLDIGRYMILFDSVNEFNRFYKLYNDLPISTREQLYPDFFNVYRDSWRIYFDIEIPKQFVDKFTTILKHNKITFKLYKVIKQGDFSKIDSGEVKFVSKCITEPTYKNYVVIKEFNGFIYANRKSTLIDFY